MKFKWSIILGILSSTILIANVSYAKEDIKLNEISIKNEYIKENYESLFKNAENYVLGISQKGEKLYVERNSLKTELGISLKKQREDNNFKIKEEMKKEIIFIRELVRNGKITKREGERQLEKSRKRYEDKIRGFRKDYESKHKKEIRARILQKEKTKEAFEKFVNAVELGEVTSIENTFNDYCENSKILNEMLKQYLNDVKIGA